jgi:hypothetical protein
MKVKFLKLKEKKFKNYGLITWLNKGRWFDIKYYAFVFGENQIQFSFKRKRSDRYE